MTETVAKKGLMLGRVLMTLATLMYGIIPPLVDLNRTHLLHPDWPAHARTHMMWLVVTNTAIAATALYFLWFGSPRALAVRISGVLGAPKRGS